MYSFTETLPKSALQSRDGDYDMLATSIGANSQQNRHFYGNHHTENEDQDNQISTLSCCSKTTPGWRDKSCDGRQEHVAQSGRWFGPACPTDDDDSWIFHFESTLSLTVTQS